MASLGRLLYSWEENRWEVHDVYDRPVSLHCGECFEIQLGTTFLPCRIELDRRWAVYVGHTPVHLHPSTIYHVRGV